MNLTQSFGVMALLFFAVAPGIAQPTADKPEKSFNISEYLPRYNVRWNSPSVSSAGSMPLVGGGIGCNVWVENGDLLFYAQQSGAFDKNGESIKMGRFRLKLDPNPFAAGAFFKQELKVKESYIQVEGELADKKRVFINLWVEAESPIIHVDIQSEDPLALTASYETWRFRDVIVPMDKNDITNGNGGWRRASIYDYDDYLPNVVKKADVIEPSIDGIVWYQDNAKQFNAFRLQLENEGLSYLRDKMWDPLENLISGGMLKCPGLEYAGVSQGEYARIPFKAWSFKSKKNSKEFSLRICGQIGIFDQVDKWKTRLGEVAGAKNDDEKTWKDNLTWWQKFWANSYVVINPDGANSEDAWRAGRNFNLVRQAFGGNAGGLAPTKFNGGNITFDTVHSNPAYVYDPDYRRWGGWSYTAANQSLVYWPYLKNGDFELMLQEFDIYRNALANSELRTKAQFGHEGCSFAEQVQTSGLPVASQYGFEKDSVRRALRPKTIVKGELGTPWIIYFYHGQLEHAFMILEYYRFTGKDISAYMPFIISCVKFYDQHYQMYHNLTARLQMETNPFDANGKLVIFPSTAGERHPAKNPAEVCAGLMAVTKAVLDLPPSLLSADQRDYFENFQKRIPELPTKAIERNGETLTIFTASDDDAPRAEGFLHSVYPYNLVVPGVPSFQIAKNSMLYKVGGLFPAGNGVYSARMGDVAVAKQNALRQLADCSEIKGRRFPTFWMTGDWGPDHNQGGRGVSTLQEMLMQTAGREIRLLPAWPANWDVAFKLHAPYGTTVEAVVKGGKIQHIKVVPESRAKDVIIMETR